MSRVSCADTTHNHLSLTKQKKRTKCWCEVEFFLLFSLVCMPFFITSIVKEEKKEEEKAKWEQENWVTKITITTSVIMDKREELVEYPRLRVLNRNV
jgi:hypothetical protein